MIKFSNGHEFEFVAASGALAYDGEGWWFDKPWRWLNVLRPEDFTIITKTLTYFPRVGYYKWWKPWECFRFIANGCVNAFGLTNPGYQWWMNKPYKYIQDKGYKVIVSIMPDSMNEAAVIARDMNACPGIVGIELNVSCPNVEHDSGVFHVCSIVDAFCKETSHPVIVKLGFDQPYLDICKALDGDPRVEAFDLINAVPWSVVYPRKKSPLPHKSGGVSGKIIREYARTALMHAKEACKTPIISGGGIDSYDEVQFRAKMGADAFSFGTVFIKCPWRPGEIVKRHAKHQ